MNQPILLGLHERSNPRTWFKSVLIIEDDIIVCQPLCDAIEQTLPNVVALGTLNPRQGLQLLNELYFDVLICDIHMPGISGDEIISDIKKQSPTTYCIAMTGHTFETAYKAGACNPDFFADKNRGLHEVLTGITKGLAESFYRRKKAFLGCYNEETNVINHSLTDWRHKRSLRTDFGYPLKRFLDSRRQLQALFLWKFQNKTTLQEKADVLGYSSVQLMKKHLCSLFDLIGFTFSKTD